MPPISTRAEAELDHSTVIPGGRLRLAMGICLFALLVFSTVTVYVRSAWPVQSFQIGVYGLAATYFLFQNHFGKAPLVRWRLAWLVYLVPVWGVLQILLHTTASTADTREATLRWGTLAGVFFLSQVVAGTRDARRALLGAFVCFATVMAVLCLLQLFTSEGKVLWIFTTGYPDVYATFPSHNNYAQFAELALPIALWRALRDGWRCWWYGLFAGLVYASVICAASRAGTVLCTAELLVVLVMGFAKFRDSDTGRPSRSSFAMLVAVPLLATGFTFIVGWEGVWGRFKQSDPYLVRREYIAAAVEMAKHRPIMGYGLGTFPAVYNQFAIKDFPFYANHVHNDWAEFAADGGVPFLLLILIPVAAAVPAAIRNPWGLGLVAIVLHAMVDYPFPRPAVSGWIFVILASLYMTRTPNADHRGRGNPVVADRNALQNVLRT